MKRAAKKRNFALMFIASTLLLCAPAIASSISLEGPKNRVEKILQLAQNRVEQLAVGSIKRDMNYDALGGNASDCLVGPNNQLLSDGEFSYEYDDEGNQIRRTNIATGEITEFEYDHRNRLTRTTVKSVGGIIVSESQYVFDVFGRRIAVINDADGAGSGIAVRENLVYDGDNVWADYDQAGEAIVRYLFGDSIDSNIARWRPSEGAAWYLTDHLGTVRGIVDATGLLLSKTTYDSFGQILVETNALLGDRYKFTGRELNSGNDFFYRARTYSATQGRFVSLDPSSFGAQDANLYRYAANSSSFLSDPTGLATFVERASLGAATAVVSFVAAELICAPLGNPPQDRFSGGASAAFGGIAGAAATSATVALASAPFIGLATGFIFCFVVPALQGHQFGQN